MRLQEMSSDELLHEFLLKPNNDVIWRILKRTIVNEAIVATINVDETTKLSNSLVFGLYGVVRLNGHGGDLEQSKSSPLPTGDRSQEAS